MQHSIQTNFDNMTLSTVIFKEMRQRRYFRPRFYKEHLMRPLPPSHKNTPIFLWSSYQGISFCPRIPAFIALLWTPIPALVLSPTSQLNLCPSAMYAQGKIHIFMKSIPMEWLLPMQTTLGVLIWTAISFVCAPSEEKIESLLSTHCRDRHNCSRLW